MTTETLDQQKVEQFAEKMIGTLNGAGLALMTSIGHQTGLFDALAELPPATSTEIAQAAGLNERYVREWLGQMVTARVIDYDPAEGLYTLPAEHAAFLTRAATPDNIRGLQPLSRRDGRGECADLCGSTGRPHSAPRPRSH